jgi:hypothetical protein
VIERPCGWEWPSAGILLLLLSLKESILVTAIHNRHIINNTFVIYVITVPDYRARVYTYCTVLYHTYTVQGTVYCCTLYVS